ncbi:NHS-like protein 1 [Archocentrus centrarchus]|uniref:NHS-like protein 1 n=1 Tax=Archocentrus centrarchus TaxID=63155 RepID=UPI0011E9DFD9|nr:NHS-like protein 1 [Archocentrus centrarchus]
MRGDRRSASFRKEKPAGLSRALSWLNVSNLSRQSRRVFQSQNELNVVHSRHPYSHSHTHLHTSDRDDGEDDDNWVYRPQHRTDGSPGKTFRCLNHLNWFISTRRTCISASKIPQHV